jgi:peptide/nickel transport system permease protein
MTALEPSLVAPATRVRRARPRGRFSVSWWVSASILMFFVLFAVFAPLWLPDPDLIDAKNILAPISWDHLMGTDEIGRDLLARITMAGRLTMSMGLGAMALSILIGGVWGMVAAAFRGWADEVLMRVADALIAIPVILFALVFVAALGASVPNLVIILGLLMAPTTARIIRSAVLGELVADYVLGLRAVGATTGRILFREVLPNIRGVLLAQATLNVATAVMVEAGLSFVGLGVQPPTATWGTILKQGYSVLARDPMYAVFPALVIVTFIAALNVFSRQTQRSLISRSSS